MTRKEFLEDVNDMDDLICFCNDNDLSTLEYVYDSDSFDSYINDCLYDKVRNNGDSWVDVKDWLNDIPDGYDYYDTEYDFEGIGDYEFDDYKTRVLDDADYYDVWEDEEDDEEVEGVEDDEEVYDSDISEEAFDFLFDIRQNAKV